jgi:sulfur carrier protein ThiS
MRIRLVFSGRGYDARGDWPEVLELPDESTLADALARVQQLGSSPLDASCLVALSGKHVGTLARHTSLPLRDGDELTIIAPVAGG